MKKGLKLEVFLRPSEKDTSIQSLIKELKAALVIEYYEKYAFTIFYEADHLLYLLEPNDEAQIVKAQKLFKQIILTVFANRMEYEDISYYWTELSSDAYQIQLDAKQAKQVGIYIGTHPGGSHENRKERSIDQKKAVSYHSLGSCNYQELLGAYPLKALIKEIRKIATIVHKNQIKQVLIARSYIFSINEGDGFSTYLDCLSQTLIDENILRIHSLKKYLEVQLEHPSKNEDPSQCVLKAISYFDESASLNGIIAIDISEWLSNLDGSSISRFS